MSKKFKLTILFLIMLISLTACSSKSEVFNFNDEINLVSREDGSGTRSAFVEITKILEKYSNGNIEDKTYEEAVIQNTTNGIMTTVSNDKNSIGYISMASINDTIKALDIDDIEINTLNIVNKSYPLARPFNIVYTDSLNDISTDFLKFVESPAGQKIIEDTGYIGLGNETSYLPKKSISGTISISGSTSVTPVMEKLSEAYMNLNPEVEIEIQATGSSAGIQSALEKISDIGMVSRELSDEEKSVLKSETIAMDGIAIIVNNLNPIESITMEEVNSVFTGQIATWNDLKE